MVYGEPPNPFYERFRPLILQALERPDIVLKELRDYDPFFYHKLYIRAFLGYSGEEIDNMGPTEFAYCMCVVQELKEFQHLPFKKRD